MTGAPVIGRFADLAVAVTEATARLGQIRLVAVDGPAGSGKTTFARRLADVLRDCGVETAQIHTDDLLSGWGSLVSFWTRIEDEVFVPLREGRPAEYRKYDWMERQLARKATIVPVPDVLIVEGVASIGACGFRGASRQTTCEVWVVAPRGLRLARGVARDGESLRPQWDRWMAAEDLYFAGDCPGPSDLVVDGASDAVHNHDQEYVVAASNQWRAQM